MVDVEYLPPATRENEVFAFLEFGDKCDVSDVVAHMADTVFFVDDERDVEIVAALFFSPTIQR